jgi:hypothetical protein
MATPALSGNLPSEPLVPPLPGPGSVSLLVGEIDASFVKRFREQIHTLGVLWLIQSGIGISLLFWPADFLARFLAEPVQMYMWLFVGVGVARVAMGAYALEKKPGAIKVGLAVTLSSELNHGK